MALMKKNERIKAVLHGEPLDRLPVAFWRHWPNDDQRPDSLAQVALHFQRTYDLDFIKLPVSSAYTVDDYKVKHEYQGSLMGDRAYLERVVKTASDWDRVGRLDVHTGTYGWHLQALGMLLKEKDPETPVIITMFDPLSVAAYLAGDDTLLTHLRTHPEKVKSAVEVLTETSRDFARECISAGADGIFLSTRFASFEILNEEEYRRFGRPGDLGVLEAASGGWFNVLHFHGQHPMLNQLADYPVQAMNWHDRTTPYSLTEAGKIFKGTLMGGVEQYKLLRFGRRDEVERQVHDAVRQMRGRRLIVTPGCTYPIDVPHANLMALRKAVETVEDL
jgi:uroporphyrinogen decarboxylase